MTNRTPSQRSIRATMVAIAVVAIAAAILGTLVAFRSNGEQQSQQALGRRVTEGDASSPSETQTSEVPSVGMAGAAGMSGALTRSGRVTAIPPIGTRATTKQWLYSRYSDEDGELGAWQLPPNAEGESRAPQGLVITNEGDLLVLDSEKDRLVWFGSDARIKRTLKLNGLKMPADVAVAADGTIAVMDHEGAQTKGTLLLTPDGTPKGMLPQSGDGMVIELYTAGNDVLAGLPGSSIKLGETSGVPSHETPHLYDQDGNIPGNVAPDGRTIVDADIESRAEGRFFVSVIRDDPPKHVFTRQYSVPVQKHLTGIAYVQSDSAGTIYVVLNYDGRNTVLVCLDGNTGEPLGTVALPPNDVMTGTYFKQFTVHREQGGLVYHQLLEAASRYGIYDCRYE